MRRFILAPSLLLGALLPSPISATPFLPTVAIEEVHFSNPGALAEWIAESNAVMREFHAIPLFIRAYERQGGSTSGSTGFLLWPGTTSEAIIAQQAQFDADPRTADLRERSPIDFNSKQRIHLIAVRFDGTHTPGWLVNHLLISTDEDALLTALKAYEKTTEGQPWINVFRLASGRADFTHLVSLNFPSEQARDTWLAQKNALPWTVSPSAEQDSGALHRLHRRDHYREPTPVSTQ